MEELSLEHLAVVLELAELTLSVFLEVADYFLVGGTWDFHNHSRIWLFSDLLCRASAQGSGHRNNSRKDRFNLHLRRSESRNKKGWLVFVGIKGQGI